MLAVFVPRPGSPPRRAPRPEAGFWTSPIGRRWLKTLLRRLKLIKPLPPEAAGLQPNPRPRPQSMFRGALLAALAGTLGTAPLVVRAFGSLPWAGLPANVLFTGLLSALVLIPGLTALAILPFSPALAAWPLTLAGGVQAALLPLMDFLAQAAGPGHILPSPGPWFLAAWFAAGWVWLRSPRPWKFRLVATLIILAAGVLPGLVRGPGDRGVLRFTVLDVGQGSSIHINFPDGRQMLADGGGSYSFDPGESVIIPYLRQQGLSRLDVAALTHPDLDHLKGLSTVAAQFRPREIWDASWPENLSRQYREFRKTTATAKRADLRELYAGRDFGGARVRLLWPPPETLWPTERPSREWINDNGLVLQVKWGETSFLITGDLGPQAEAALAARYGRELQSTVLTAPHHGGQTALSPVFLEAVNPGWITFSVGRNNAFGHPHPETLRRARASDANIRRTDLEGAAIFEVRLHNGSPTLEVKPPRVPRIWKDLERQKP
jgi:competence protein ComEC